MSPVCHRSAAARRLAPATGLYLGRYPLAWVQNRPDGRRQSDRGRGPNPWCETTRGDYRFSLGAAAGLLSAAAGVGASMIVSVIVGGAPTPITAVGSRVIDATPGAVKDWAIRTLGTNDKPFLLAGIYTAIGLLAAVTGVLAWRSRRLALGLASALGLIGLAAAAPTGPRWSSPPRKVLPAARRPRRQRRFPLRVHPRLGRRRHDLRRRRRGTPRHSRGSPSPSAAGARQLERREHSGRPTTADPRSPPTSAAADPKHGDDGENSGPSRLRPPRLPRRRDGERCGRGRRLRHQHASSAISAPGRETRSRCPKPADAAPASARTGRRLERRGPHAVPDVEHRLLPRRHRALRSLRSTPASGR